MQESLDTVAERNPWKILANISPKTYTGRYAMHKYWARKPYNIVSKYIELFSQKGEIVLDPFCGSGVTPFEALALDRKAIAVDLNPVATFITKMTAVPVNISDFVKAFKCLEKNAKDRINSLYQTKCPRCDGNAVILNTIWKDGIPIEIKFECANCDLVGRKEPDLVDNKRIKDIEQSNIPYWFPQTRLLPNSRINVKTGMSIPDLFTKRNLIALSILWNEIQSLHVDNIVKDLLKFTFTSCVSQASRMVFVIRRRGGRRKKQQYAEVGSRVIGYWIPSENFEINVWNCFENRYRKVLRGKKETNQILGQRYKEAESFEELKKEKTLLVRTQTATDLSFLPNESVDYVFTDPPFGDQVPYLELDTLWASWLGFEMDYENEIVISDSPVRSKGFEEYKHGITEAIREIYRVLKFGRYLSIAFYNYDVRVWHALISACVEAGFEKVGVLPIIASHPSIIQIYRPNGTKGALVITFRKCNQNERFLDSKVLTHDLGNEIVEEVTNVIARKGFATTYEVYDVVLTVLIKNNALDKDREIFKFLEGFFDYSEGRWKLRKSQ